MPSTARLYETQLSAVTDRFLAHLFCRIQGREGVRHNVDQDGENGSQDRGRVEFPRLSDPVPPNRRYMGLATVNAQHSYTDAAPTVRTYS